MTRCTWNTITTFTGLCISWNLELKLSQQKETQFSSSNEFPLTESTFVFSLLVIGGKEITTPSASTRHG